MAATRMQLTGRLPVAKVCWLKFQRPDCTITLPLGKLAQSTMLLLHVAVASATPSPLAAVGWADEDKGMA